MNSNTRHQLTSSSAGDHLDGPRDPRYPVQSHKGLHNPQRNIHAAVSSKHEALQRVRDIQQTSSKTHRARVEDRRSCSPPPSTSTPQSTTSADKTRPILKNGLHTLQSSIDLQPSIIVNFATRLNNEIVQLSPPLRAMANHLLRLMGAREENMVRRLEMCIPGLWCYMPPLLLCLRIFLASGISQILADGMSGPGMNGAYGQHRARDTVGTRTTTEAAQKDAYRQGDELQETSTYVDTPSNCEDQPYHHMAETHGIPYIGENTAGATVHDIESHSASENNSGHRGQDQVDGRRRVHQTDHVPIRSTDPTSVGGSGGQADYATRLDQTSGNVDTPAHVEEQYPWRDGYVPSDRQIARGYYTPPRGLTTIDHRSGSSAFNGQNRGHDALSIEDNCSHDANGLIPEQHVHPPPFSDADAGTHVQSNYPTIIQLEEFVRPLTTEACQAQIAFTGWADESEGAGEASTSSSGGSRRKKRRSDEIDDDNGIGSSSTSASAERQAKRPRRKNKKGLEPSASSSRTGTTAGASDLQANI